MRTWKGTTAGVLTIIGGIFGIAAGGLALLGTTFLAEMTGFGFLGALGGGFLALGIIALIGGIFALRRKIWGLALTGAIFALFPVIPLGVVAIIFIALAKNEFE